MEFRLGDGYNFSFKELVLFSSLNLCLLRQDGICELKGAIEEVAPSLQVPPAGINSSDYMQGKNPTDNSSPIRALRLCSYSRLQGSISKDSMRKLDAAKGRQLFQKP